MSRINIMCEQQLNIVRALMINVYKCAEMPQHCRTVRENINNI